MAARPLAPLSSSTLVQLLILLILQCVRLLLAETGWLMTEKNAIQVVILLAALAVWQSLAMTALLSPLASKLAEMA